MTFKYFNMNSMYKITPALLIMIVAIACGSSAKEKKGEETDKKVELQRLKDQQAKLNDRIRSIEEDLAKSDTTAAKANAKLVVVTPVEQDTFTHYIDLQG